jgi:hypothetical protein
MISRKRAWAVRAATTCFALSAGAAAAQTDSSYSPYAEEAFARRVFWGDTHLHTTLSPDAYLFGNRQLSPDDAYRFAKGDVITGHNGMPVRLRRPLDFLVVTDHAEYLGVLPALAEEDPLILSTAAGRRWAEGLREDPARVWAEFGDSLLNNRDLIESPAFERSIWDRVVANAERHNLPGHFTAFIGYEYTSTTNGDNLHRNVIFRDGAEKAGTLVPFSSLDSDRPEDLWAYMADYEDRTGGSVIAIPHNSNISGGLMFRLEDSDGEPLTREQAERRIRFEPLVEATQYKGDSETHPYLSPEDEFADYETWDAGNIGLTKAHQDDWFRHEYVRSALKLGLGLAASLGVNPFQFGLIGSTDAHTSLAAADERDFWGKFSKTEPSPERMMLPMFEAPDAPRMMYEWQMAASGYAAVWARDNTRESLFDAMRRRETYATTGPRMVVRFFGGWDFESNDAYAADLAERGYARGVPMGAELAAVPRDGAAPTFLISALKDPDGANLDRVQIVKGWRRADGTLHEKVYDVALADGRKPGLFDGRIPPVGNTVNVENATYENSIGDTVLTTVWTDPAFAADEHAFYYARVLEIPTPRWTTFDAVRFGIELPEEIPKTTQERAYTSAIWYAP